MHRLKRWREPFFAAVFLVLTGWMIVFASNILRPKQEFYGSAWNAFLAEPADSLDVLWLGSSFAYCDVDPVTVYANSGLTGFVLGGSEQPLGLTYWYLREALRTQSPACVVLEATSLFFRPYQNYTEQNVAQMPLSLNRLGAIFTAAEPALRPDLLFDLSLYHNRWSQLQRTDLRVGILGPQPSIYKGYTPVYHTREGVTLALSIEDRWVSPEDYAANLAWMDKIFALCRAHGVQCIVTVNPSYSRCPPETYARIGAELQALDSSVDFRDWSACFEEIGLRPLEHLYDGGHLNQEGAAVFSAWLAGFLTEEAGLAPRPQSAENTAAWRSAVQTRAEEQENTN